MSGFETDDLPEYTGDEEPSDDFPRELPPEYQEFGQYCGATSPSGDLICKNDPDHPEGQHSWAFYEPPAGTWSAGPAPVPNDYPSMHDMVIRDLLSRDPRWDLSYGTGRHIRDRVTADLNDRKAFGLAKYGTVLQPFNGRDSLRDLYDELMDAAVYARARLFEAGEHSLEWMILAEVYEDVVSNLVKVRRLRDANSVAPEVLDEIGRMTTEFLGEPGNPASE